MRLSPAALLECRLLLLGLGFALACIPGPAVAVVVDGLYETEVSVGDQGAESRRVAFGKALTQVLMKITGEPDLAARRDYASIRAKAPRLVQQYRYRAGARTAQSDSDSAEGVSTAEPASKYRLWVQFAPPTVDRALSEWGIAVWGKERPQTLVWLAVESSGERAILGSDSRDRVSQRLRKAAEERGVPLLLPLMDIQDQAAVNYADIRGRFYEAIMAASSRYQVNSILIGSLAADPLAADPEGLWTAQWTFRTDEQVMNWRSDSSGLDLVLRSGVAGVAKMLSSLLGVGGTGEEAGHILVRVGGIDSLQDYARAGKYLAGLSMVKTLQVDRVTGSSVRYRVELLGGAAGLQRVIALGGTLAAEVPRAPGHGEGNGGDADDVDAYDGKDGTGLGAELADLAELSYRLLP